MSEDARDSRELPSTQLPGLGDQAFVAEGLFHETACVLSDSWWGHAVSYKETADIVVRHALRDTSSLDFVILPVCFLYRHYLELALKALVRDVARVRDIDPPKLDHDLASKWRFVREAFPQPDETLAATEELLEQWANLDPGSLSFRYPTDKKGAPSLPASLVHLNIRRIADVIDKIDAVFSGMAGYLDAAIDSMSDAANY